MASESLTDEQYRERYLSRLQWHLEKEGMQPSDSAQRIAEECYARCPRDQMLTEFATDPEKAADDEFVEWGSDRDDDDDREWAGDNEDDWDQGD